MPNRMMLLERRQRRTRELTHDDLDERVREGLRQVCDLGRSPEAIRIRPEFIILNLEARRGGVDRPGAARLRRSRGIALRFYLLALFERQCHKGAQRASNQRPLEEGEGGVTWADLVAVDAKREPNTTKQRRTRLTATVRQIKGALDTLEDEGLAEVPRDDHGERLYSEFILMHEGGRGKLTSPHIYTLPKANEHTVGIPVDFFLNGWVHVLHPSETTAWLMFRYLAWCYPREHDAHGNYVSGDRLVEDFGLNREAYETHEILRALRLLRFAIPPDDPDDPFASLNGYRRARGELHRFQLTDTGLTRPAVPTMLDWLVEAIREHDA
jgi:hypothetical protein